MEVIINNHTYEDGQKIKWDEFGDVIYGTIHYGLFDLDGSRKMSKNNIVLISEYNMPSDFECIWSKETLANFDSNRKVNDDKNKRVEKLFIYKGDKLK